MQVLAAEKFLRPPSKCIKKPPFSLPRKQIDWDEYRQFGVVKWRPRKFELQFIGGIQFGFEPWKRVVGSFNNNLVSLPSVIEIDPFLSRNLKKGAIVWTPKRRGIGNVDRTEWAALWLRIRATNHKSIPWEIYFERVNDCTFDIFQANDSTTRLELYVAKDQREIYRHKRFW